MPGEPPYDPDEQADRVRARKTGVIVVEIPATVEPRRGGGAA